MSATPQNHEELTRLISGLLDGHLSESERARLGALLEADPAARRLYMQMVDQEVELSCLLLPAVTQEQAGKNILPLVQTGASPAASNQRSRFPRWLAAAAVFVILATASAMLLWWQGGMKSTKTVSHQAVAGATIRESWSEDFEKGLPPGWIGTLVSTNLPPGSQYALAPGMQQWPEGVSHVISLPADWDGGLFALTERSTLHLTYRFARGAHVNVFMHGLAARDNEPSMFQLRPGDFPRSDRQWQTVSIPFSRFVRKVPALDGQMQFIGGPPRRGERVAVLSFSWIEPIDFVIDRIWVTPTDATEPQFLNPTNP